MTWDVNSDTISAVTAEVAKGIVSLVDGLCFFSSAVGGAGVALSYVVNEQVNMSYYSQAYTPGLLVITIHIPKQDITFTEAIPFYHRLKQEGQQTYNSQDYCPPHLILQLSLLLIFSSLFFKMITAGYKKWLDYFDDHRLLKQDYKIGHLQPPSFKEYQIACFKEGCNSIVAATLGCTLVGGVMSLSWLNRFSQNITRPLTGTFITDSKYYHGPLTSDFIPVELSLKYNATVDLAHLHTQLMIEETAQTKTVANVTYGGGLFFKAKNNNAFPVVLPAILTTSAYALSSILAKKEKKARDDRIFEARESAYNLM